MIFVLRPFRLLLLPLPLVDAICCISYYFIHSFFRSFVRSFVLFFTIEIRYG